ncbi:chaperone SicP [Vibrio sp. Of14-4]|uniref:Chaperone SicP n=1 Tax=Vibrio tetraodonis subsp. pristinus TaxID=2695891 RepID=A0A6L8LRA2_9VIBR|nr:MULTISPECIES: chaperone SicP [Vibrio]MCG7490134.1 chaperone SicP [Vibrio sp. Of14-4]MYM58548.1 chaperone SicP [Vibrio tetraodonis subsp. pristinus]
MNHELALNRLGEQLGLPLEFDQSNQCMLLLDSHLLISIRPKSEGWIVTCLLTKIEPEHEDMLLKQALLVNNKLHQINAGYIYFEDHSKVILYVTRLENVENTEEITTKLTEVINRYEELQSLFHLQELTSEDVILLRGSKHDY